MKSQPEKRGWFVPCSRCDGRRTLLRALAREHEISSKLAMAKHGSHP